MIFTTSIARPNVTPSELFKVHGNTSDIVCPISDSPIFGLTMATNPDFLQYRTHFWVAVVSYILDKKVPMATYIPLGQNDHKTMYKSPPIGVSFSTNLSENRVDKMISLGFVRKNVGRTSFYRGTVDRKDIPYLLELRAEIDTFVPYGLSNLSGYIAFWTLVRLLDSAFAAVPYPAFSRKNTPEPKYAGTHTSNACPPLLENPLR